MKTIYQMEDTCVHLNPFVYPTSALFAVFDGHGGKEAALAAQKILPKRAAEQIEAQEEGTFFYIGIISKNVLFSRLCHRCIWMHMHIYIYIHIVTILSSRAGRCPLNMEKLFADLENDLRNSASEGNLGWSTQVSPLVSKKITSQEFS